MPKLQRLFGLTTPGPAGFELPKKSGRVFFSSALCEYRAYRRETSLKLWSTRIEYSSECAVEADRCAEVVDERSISWCRPVIAFEMFAATGSIPSRKVIAGDGVADESGFGGDEASRRIDLTCGYLTGT